MCNSKIELPIESVFVFTWNCGDEYGKSVMLFDSISQKARIIKIPRLDVGDGKSVIVKKAMIVFEEGSPGFGLRAYKYTSFEDPTNTVKTALDSLPYDDILYEFNVCNLANRLVILSGGENGEGVTAKVHALDTSTWKWQLLPDLNVARSSHSSTCLAGAVYVTGGMDNNNDCLNSVERL